MGKVILSTKNFYKRIFLINWKLDDYIEVSCRNGEMKIGDFSISVAHSMNFKSIVTGKSLNNLKKLCSYLEEQPITISFDENSTIEVTNAIL